MDEVLFRVQELAEDQHSVVSIKQMLECGATRKWILRRSTAGIIVKAGPSAFRMGCPHVFVNLFGSHVRP